MVKCWGWAESVPNNFYSFFIFSLQIIWEGFQSPLSHSFTPFLKISTQPPSFWNFQPHLQKREGGGRLCESSLLYLIDICWPMVWYFYNLFLTYIRKPLPLIYTANSQIFRLSKWCSYWMTVWQGLHLKFDEAYI